MIIRLSCESDIMSNVLEVTELCSNEKNLTRTPALNSNIYLDPIHFYIGILVNAF